MPYDGPMNEKLLNFDALAEAEKATGKSYKDDEETSSLGFDLHLAASTAKRRMLAEACDTYHGQPLEEYLEVVRSLGFIEAVRQPFVNYQDETKTETYFIFWHPTDGILLSFDTYHCNHVNGGHFYYNWIPDKTHKDWFTCVSSGWGNDINGRYVWSGDHDCREALKYHICQMRDHGKFLVPWESYHMVWLGHFTERNSKSDALFSKEYADWSTDLNMSYIRRLPKDAQDCIVSVYEAHENEYKANRTKIRTSCPEKE